MTRESRGSADDEPAAATADHRHYVGPTERFDLATANQFILLTHLGLREEHSVLDIGCGSLRAGRLLITYLSPGRYFGIEPAAWLIDEGIRNEIGQDLVDLKRPRFNNDADFTLSVFGETFDFILANSIFSHASQRQIARCLDEARKTMHPTSMFAATYIEGDEDYAGDEWVYPACVTYTPQAMGRLAEEQGLACTPYAWPHPGNQRWVLFTLPEHAGNITQPGDAARMAYLKNELSYSRQRLARLERHPYVRAGLSVRNLFLRFRRAVRRP